MRSKKSSGQIWNERMKRQPSKINVLYCAGRDIEPRLSADEHLIPYDIWTNKAHVLMLHKQQLIPATILAKILRALDALSKCYRSGKFRLDPLKEDVHMNIEAFVQAEAGPEASGWLHTARSRNDQTTTDVRLYVRDRVLDFFGGIEALVGKILTQAAKHLETPMPGYTHGRPAAVTTFAHYLASYAQALVRDLGRLQFAFGLLNQCPLGAVAAFGTTWPIDRDYSARLLAFELVQVNNLDCVTSRWEMEAEVAGAVAFFMTHLSTVAQDLLFFSDPCRGFLTIDERYLTGSSVMPQKQNLDFAEVTRAKASLVQSYAQALHAMARGMLSGYNRDSQWTKYVIIDLFEEVHYAPRIFSDVIASLKVNADAMLRHTQFGFINAVEIADFLAQTKALPFRSAHRLVAKAVKQSQAAGRMELATLNQVLKDDGHTVRVSKKEWTSLEEPLKRLGMKQHLGAPSPRAVRSHLQGLERLRITHRNWLTQKLANLNTAKKGLEKEIKKYL
jgi:argininosuccinate lyase